MNGQPSAIAPAARPAAPDRGSTLWGLDEVGLHDRFWAGRGIRVVRRGCPLAASGAARLYLLLEPDELVLFDPPAAMRRRSGVRCVQVTHTDPCTYRERVVADASGRLASLHRHYEAPVHSRTQVMLTADPRLALLWHRAAGGRAGLGDVRLAAGLKGFQRASAPGRVFRTTGSPHGGFSHALLELRPEAGSMFAGVRAVQPGVWIHPQAQVAEGVRFVGPVWVGAGVMLGPGEVVVGPRIIGDTLPTPACRLEVAGRRARAPLALSARPGRKTGWPDFGRRAFDIAFSAVALALAAPLFPLIALAIRLEDCGPAIFGHTRQTVGGRNFTCLKFRTMCRDAEKLKPALAAFNRCDGPQFHLDDDPRLLRVGRFLRRFHLDELPQFVNVLRGQMSVIGPRPSPDAENQFCPAWRDARLSVKPGLTGLWQVCRTRAANQDFQEWIRHDLEYVGRRSWRLDLMIIAKTAGSLLHRMRAHPADAAKDAAERRAGHLPPHRLPARQAA